VIPSATNAYVPLIVSALKSCWKNVVKSVGSPHFVESNAVPAPPTVRDVTVAPVGESIAGDSAPGYALHRKAERDYRSAFRRFLVCSVRST